MNISASAQVLVFFAMVLCGVMCGILFDLFRGIRYRRKTSGGVVAVQDLIFWILELILVYAVIFAINYAYVRVFELIALILGSVLYFMTLSDFVVSFVSKLTYTAEKAAAFILKPFVKAFFIGKKISCAVKTRLTSKYTLILNKIKQKSSSKLKNFAVKIKKMNKLPKKVKK